MIVTFLLVSACAAAFMLSALTGLYAVRYYRKKRAYVPIGRNPYETKEQRIKRCEITLHDAVRNDQDNLIEHLLEEGADPNCKNNSGQTALYCATAKRNNKIAKMLIEGGARVDEENTDGSFPSIYAAKVRDVVLFSLLLSKKANIHKKNKDGESVATIVESTDEEMQKIMNENVLSV